MQEISLANKDTFPFRTPCNSNNFRPVPSPGVTSILASQAASGKTTYIKTNNYLYNVLGLLPHPKEKQLHIHCFNSVHPKQILPQNPIHSQ